MKPSRESCCLYSVPMNVAAKLFLAVTVWTLCLPAFGLPDLRVQLKGPESAIAGSDVGNLLSVIVYNVGNQSARGTDSSQDGYMVDLFMTQGPMPTGYARYAEKYFDGVLLKGGRISNTKTLPPGKRAPYKTRAVIPPDTTAGTFKLCARVDPGRKLGEASESNNTSCIDLQINRLQVFIPTTRWKALKVEPKDIKLVPFEPKLVAPERKPISPPKPLGDSTAKRSVLEDGTLVIAYPDGSQRSLLPDGTTVYTSPDGTVMMPLAIQVQGTELPELPEGLSQWGGQLANYLTDILQNLLTELEMQAYRKTELDKDYYDLIEWRIRSIRFLTAQETTE